MENIDGVLIHTNKIISSDDESITYRNGFLRFLNYAKSIKEDLKNRLDYQFLKEIFYMAEESNPSDKYKEGVEDAVNYLSGKNSQDFKMTEYYTNSAIAIFTLGYKENTIGYCEEHGEDIKKVVLEEHSGQITMKDDYKIRFALLSNFLEDFDEIDEETKKELESIDRLGKCHSGSIDIAQTFSYPCSVVTGYIYGVSNKDKILHSWIEFDLGNKEMVIDYTLNVIMDKSSYIRLHKAKEIKRIKSKDLKKDINSGILEKLGLFINKRSKDEQRVIIASYKEYLLFREEILRDLWKSKVNDINIKEEDINY